MFGIEEIIREKDLKIKKVEKMMNVSTSTLRTIRKGHTNIRLSQVQGVINFFEDLGYEPKEILDRLKKEKVKWILMS